MRARVLAILALPLLPACRGTNAYWRGDPARDVEAAKTRGDYGPIALRDGDSLIIPGVPDSLRKANLNMNVGRIDSVTLSQVGPGQRDSVLGYAATYNAPIFQEVLRVRARARGAPR